MFINTRGGKQFGSLRKNMRIKDAKVLDSGTGIMAALTRIAESAKKFLSNPGLHGALGRIQDLARILDTGIDWGSGMASVGGDRPRNQQQNDEESIFIYYLKAIDEFAKEDAYRRAVNDRKIPPVYHGDELQNEFDSWAVFVPKKLNKKTTLKMNLKIGGEVTVHKIENNSAQINEILFPSSSDPSSLFSPQYGVVDFMTGSNKGWYIQFGYKNSKGKIGSHGYLFFKNKKDFMEFEDFYERRVNYHYNNFVK